MSSSYPRLTTKNWSEFQHYKDRSPTWIKLHKGLLDNFEFQCLPVASKALAPMLWLLASEESDGSIEFNVKKIAFRLRMSPSEVDDAVKPLIDSGFFTLDANCCQPASTTLAECLPREREREREDKEANASVPGEAGDQQKAEAANRNPACPAEAIVELYHRHMPDNPAVRVLNDKRRKMIRARWKEAAGLTCKPFGYGSREEGLKAWAAFFEVCAESEFLTGKTKPAPGKPPFVADIDFLMAPDSFAKCLENKYHRELA